MASNKNFPETGSILKKTTVISIVLLTLSLLLLFGYSEGVNSGAKRDRSADNASDNRSEDKKTAESKCADEKTSDPNATQRGKRLEPLHDHKAFRERINDRQRLLQTRIIPQGIDDPNVLKAMATVPRHNFVPGEHLGRAYGDYPLPIGYGQTISQPYVVAYMTEALKLDPNDIVLEIGTGSGYQAAVCAEIAHTVYTIEIVTPLAKSAKKRLKTLGYRNVNCKGGDGYFGWPEEARFDAIIVTAAAPLVPPPLIEQLKPQGKMILPLGSPYGAQSLVLVEKDNNNKIKSKSLLPVRFVPMTGRVQTD
jgi:protein-L-isoaspartate(D-aspartate) O-methyltransferase